MKKSELRKQYPGLPVETIRTLINIIISQNRAISYEEAKRKKTILPAEYKRFVSAIGAPIAPGQKISDHTPTKKEIYTMFPDVPKSIIRNEINDILKLTRGYPGYEKEKVLFPREWEIFKKMFE